MAGEEQKSGRFVIVLLKHQETQGGSRHELLPQSYPLLASLKAAVSEINKDEGANIDQFVTSAVGVAQPNGGGILRLLSDAAAQ